MRSSRNAAGCLLLLATVGFFAIGNTLLDHLGIPYSTPGGIIVARIHPSTYCCFLALALTLIDTDSRKILLRRMRVEKLSMTFLFIIVICCIFLSFRPGSAGFSYLVDTYAASIIVFLLFYTVSDLWKKRIISTSIFLLVLNSALAVAEGLSRANLIDFNYGGDQFRATALLGHPLNNALVTAPAV